MDFKLLDYAANHWSDHTRGDLEIELEDLVFQFLENEGQIINAFQTCDKPTFEADGLALPYRQCITILHGAAYWGLEHIMRILLQRGFDPSPKGSYFRTPLVCAASKGYNVLVGMLLDEGADPDVYTPHGAALHVVASENYLNIAKLLLKSGANPNNYNPAPELWSHQDSPLGCASGKGHLEMVRLLLHAGAACNPPDRRFTPPLVAACRDGHRSVVEELLRAGAFIDVGSGYSLNIQMPFLLHLIEAGAIGNGIDGTSGTALSTCIRWKHVNLAEFLLASGADPNGAGGFFNVSPLELAALQGGEVLVRLLLNHGANVNLRGGELGTPLHHAVAGGNPEVVDLLLSSGADPNLYGGLLGKETSLIWAIRGGKYKMVVRLLEAGADVDLADQTGQTALHYATIAGGEKMLQSLFKVSKSIDNSSSSETTAKEKAKRKPLLSLNKISSLGITPLHVAIHNGWVDGTGILVEIGADPRIIDPFGKTSLDWASQYRPLFEKMDEWRLSHVPTSRTAQLVHMRNSVRSLVKMLIEDYSPTESGNKWDWEYVRSKYNLLGKCFLQYGDLEQARTSYEQLTPSPTPSGSELIVEHNANCDMCGQKIFGQRFVCVVCINIDFCSTCMPIYNLREEPNGRCTGHSFLDVPGPHWKERIERKLDVVNDLGEDRVKWLEGLLSKYEEDGEAA